MSEFGNWDEGERKNEGGGRFCRTLWFEMALEAFYNEMIYANKPVISG